MHDPIQNELLKRFDRLDANIEKINEKLDNYQVRLVTVEQQQGFIRRGFNLVLATVSSVITYLIYKFIDTFGR